MIDLHGLSQHDLLGPVRIDVLRPVNLSVAWARRCA
jgi:hypothetical protein